MKKKSETTTRTGGRILAELLENRIEESVPHWDPLIGAGPQGESVYISRGIRKTELGRYEEAITDYDRAIRLDPEDAFAYNGRGIAKDSLGRHAEA